MLFCKSIFLRNPYVSQIIRNQLAITTRLPSANTQSCKQYLNNCQSESNFGPFSTFTKQFFQPLLQIGTNCPPAWTNSTRLVHFKSSQTSVEHWKLFHTSMNQRLLTNKMVPKENKVSPGHEKQGDGELTPSSSTSTSSPSPPDQPLSRQAKLKQAVKDYGSTVLVFHITMSLCSLGMFYLLVSSGLDMAAILSQIGIGEQILQNKITEGASTFVVAYAIHKVFAPVRITITLTATPFIVKKLRGMGILKKPIQK